MGAAHAAQASHRHPGSRQFLLFVGRDPANVSGKRPAIVETGGVGWRSGVHGRVGGSLIDEPGRCSNCRAKASDVFLKLGYPIAPALTLAYGVTKNPLRIPTVDAAGYYPRVLDPTGCRCCRGTHRPSNHHVFRLAPRESGLALRGHVAGVAVDCCPGGGISATSTSRSWCDGSENLVLARPASLGASAWTPMAPVVTGASAKINLSSDRCRRQAPAPVHPRWRPNKRNCRSTAHQPAFPLPRPRAGSRGAKAIVCPR